MKTIKITILTLFSLFLLNSLQSQINSDYYILSEDILNSSDDSTKMILAKKLEQSLNHELNKNMEEIELIDSTGLLFVLTSDDKYIQIVSWSIELNGEWEYSGFIKSYNSMKKKYQVYKLEDIGYFENMLTTTHNDVQNWPGCVYTKLIENEYNKRKYYTLLGWLAPQNQTAFKLIEVLSISKSGKPYFGKTKYFKKDKAYQARILFSYSRSSKFLLDYGEYQYSTRKWNRKKKRYDNETFTENLIVFDHLIPQYPGMEHMPEFLVPTGNLIDAYQFSKGKWIYISDIDARNLKKKEFEKAPPQLNLFEEKAAPISN